MSASVCAQLQVDNSSTVAELVSEVLLGEGVEFSNITYNLAAANVQRSQVGYFSGGAPYIGIDQGIIIASGRVEVAEGPNTIPTAHLTVPQNEQLNNDPDLSELIGINNLRDVAMVEFDFKAKGDTLRFRYVFASEEYNDHTCSPYNDAFGFFVSGPGIQGNPNFSNTAKNVALVPNTNIPVAINTVNQGFAGIYGANAVCNATSPNWQANSVYFVDNSNNTAPETTQFDGYTVPFLIEIPVICGETYHIKMAIADAVDDKNDSAVFIEAESFSSEILLDAALEVLQPENDAPDTALEGCSSYLLHLTRSDSSHAKTIYLRTQNLENRSVIIPNLPAEVNFLEGEGSKHITFETYTDGEHHGFRQWELQLLHPEACGQDTAIFSLSAKIVDRSPLILNAPDTLFIPCHTTVGLSIDLEGGNPPYYIQWSDSTLTGSNISLSTLTDAAIEVRVTDDCNLHDIERTIQLQAEAYDELTVSAPNHFTFGCAEPVAIHAEVQGGVGEYEYSWWFDNVLIGSDEALEYLFNAEGNLILEVDDRCAEPASVQIEAQLLANPVVVELGEDREGSCQYEMLLLPEVIGGFGDLNYTWYVNNLAVETHPIFTFQPEQTVRISLEVSDECGQMDADTLFVFVNDPDLNVLLPPDTTVCAGERVELTPVVSGAIGDVVYSWPVTGGALPSYSYLARTPAYFNVRVQDACGRTAEAGTQINVSEVIADFEFDYDFPENGIRNFSSTHASPLWTFPDGSTSTVWEPVYMPQMGQSAPVILELKDQFGCEARKVAFFDPPMDIFIPNAFTPDGSGHNDQFMAVGRYVAEWHLLIYDKWGTLIFESRNLQDSWDGSGTRRSDHLSTDNIYTYRYMAKSWAGVAEEGMGTVILLK